MTYLWAPEQSTAASTSTLRSVDKVNSNPLLHHHLHQRRRYHRLHHHDLEGRLVQADSVLDWHGGWLRQGHWNHHRQVGESKGECDRFHHHYCWWSNALSKWKPSNTVGLVLRSSHLDRAWEVTAQQVDIYNSSPKTTRDIKWSQTLKLTNNNNPKQCEYYIQWCPKVY